MFVMTSSRDAGTIQYQTSYRGLKDSWPCNQFLLNLRTIEKAQNREPAKNAALLVHKKAYDCSFEHACEAEGNTVSCCFFFYLFNDGTYKSRHRQRETSLSKRSDLTPEKRCREHRIQSEPCEQNGYPGQKVIRCKIRIRYRVNRALVFTTHIFVIKSRL